MCFLDSLLFIWILIPSVGLVLFVFGFFVLLLVLSLLFQIAWFIYVLSPLVVSYFSFLRLGYFGNVIVPPRNSALGFSLASSSFFPCVGSFYVC